MEFRVFHWMSSGYSGIKKFNNNNNNNNNSVQFNSCFFTCKLNSPEHNYNVSASKMKETTNIEVDPIGFWQWCITHQTNKYWIQKEVIVSKFKVLFHSLPKETKGNHRKRVTSFAPSASRIWSGNSVHSTATFSFIRLESHVGFGTRFLAQQWAWLRCFCQQRVQDLISGRPKSIVQTTHQFRVS
jgi:hypothetical protein